MAAVKIVTDSTADLEYQYLKEYDISCVPLQVRFGEETLKDRVEISPSEFYARLTQTKSPVSTSQPSPGDFYNVYKSIADQGDSIISIHLSGDFSGTYQTASLAKTMLPEADIQVIDSRSVSVGLGLIVLAAAKAAKQGKTSAEITALVNELIPKIKIYFIVDTLEYLMRGGRIGRASSFLGTLLNIKPILGISEGVVVPVEKVRGKNKAYKRLIEMVKQQINNNSGHFGAVHADNKSGLLEFVQKLRAEVNCDDMLFGELGSVVGCHGGPGLVGIAFYS